MGLFRKKAKVIDLSERLRSKQEKIDNLKKELRGESPKSASNLIRSDSEGSFFSFLGNSNKTAGSDNSSENRGDVDSEDKKRKLAKRLADITTRLEEVSNSIYKIEQRLELIEKKMNIKDH